MNTFKLENYELVQAIQNREIPSVLIILNEDEVSTPTVRCTNTLEVQALKDTLDDKYQTVLSLATGAMKAGASVVIGNDLAPEFGNDIRVVVTSAYKYEASDGDEPPVKVSQLRALEGDGIFRVVVTDYDSPIITEQGVTPTEADKSRFVKVGAVGTPSVTTEDTRLQVHGYIAGQICVGYFQDSALPYNNIPVPMLDASEVQYKTQAQLNTSFHDGLVVFYNVNGQPCIFGIPTLATYSQTALWFDLTVRQTTDYVADAIIYDLKQKYPRTKRSQETLSSIKATVLGVLDSMASRQIIENVENANCVVMTDPSDVYGIIISYTIDVITPLYVVTIKQSVTLGDNSTVLVG